MKINSVILAIISLVLISNSPSAFSELVDSPAPFLSYFDANTHIDSCAAANRAYFEFETVKLSTEEEKQFSKSVEAVEKTKEHLKQAQLYATLQGTIGYLNPTFYSGLGYLCASNLYDGVSSAVEAVKYTLYETEQAKEQVDFAIGESKYTGRAMGSLAEGHMDNKLAETIEEMNSLTKGKKRKLADWLIPGIIKAVGKKDSALDLAVKYERKLITAREQLDEEVNLLNANYEEAYSDAKLLLQNANSDGTGSETIAEFIAIKQIPLDVKLPVDEIQNGQRLILEAEKTKRSADKLASKKIRGSMGEYANRVQTASETLESAKVELNSALRQMKQIRTELKKISLDSITRTKQMANREKDPLVAHHALDEIQSIPIGKNIESIAELVTHTASTLEETNQIQNSLLSNSELKGKVAQEIRETYRIVDVLKQMNTDTSDLHSEVEFSSALEAARSKEDIIAIEGTLNEVKQKARTALAGEQESLKTELDKLNSLRELGVATTNDEKLIEEVKRTLNSYSDNSITQLPTVKKKVQNALSDYEYRVNKAIETATKTINQTLIITTNTPTVENATGINQTEPMDISRSINESNDLQAKYLTAFYSNLKGDKLLEETIGENHYKLLVSITKDLAKANQMKDVEKANKLMLDLQREMNEVKQAVELARQKALQDEAILEKRAGQFGDNQTKQAVELASQAIAGGKYKDAIYRVAIANKAIDGLIEAQTPKSSTGNATASSSAGGFPSRDVAIGGAMLVILMGSAYLFLKKQKGSSSLDGGLKDGSGFDGNT